MSPHDSTKSATKKKTSKKHAVAALKAPRAASPASTKSTSLVWRSLGLTIQSLDAFREVVHAGIGVEAYEHFRRAIEVSNEDLARVLAIPQRTFDRRRSQGRLKPDESDRLARLSMLFEYAVKLFEGNQERAAQWFRTPKRALDNTSPLEFADTEPGAQEVRDLIGRLEHGVFS